MTLLTPIAIWNDLSCGCSESQFDIIVDYRCEAHGALIPDRDRDYVRRDRRYLYGPIRKAAAS